MRRLQELKNSKRLLAGPYLFWAVSFIIIPLIMIFYYGLTDNDGKFTWMNLAKITTPENIKALGLALLLAFVSTVICLILAYPLAMILAGRNVNQSSFVVLVFILPMWMNFLLRTLAWQNLLEKTVSSTPFSISSGCLHGTLSTHRQRSSSVWSTTSCRSWCCRFTMYL